MPPMAVAVEDHYGNLVTSDSSNVTLSLGAAASGGGGVLEGTTTVAAVDGLATFSGLSIVDPSNPPTAPPAPATRWSPATPTRRDPGGRHVGALQHDA